MTRPSIARTVHYVSYGTPGGEYESRCRAAIVTEVGADGVIGLCVLNPTGVFFRSLADGGCAYNDGSETPGSPGCPNASNHGVFPGRGVFRYCACGWAEAGHKGGTWHWPERIES